MAVLLSLIKVGDLIVFLGLVVFFAVIGESELRNILALLIACTALIFVLEEITVRSIINTGEQLDRNIDTLLEISHGREMAWADLTSRPPAEVDLKMAVQPKLSAMSVADYEKARLAAMQNSPDGIAEAQRKRVLARFGGTTADVDDDKEDSLGTYLSGREPPS